MVRYMKKVVQVTATTTAQDIKIQNTPFFISNASAAETVYIKDKQGVDVTASNGFAIPPLTTVQNLLTCDTLSIIAGANTAKVSIMLTDIG